MDVDALQLDAQHPSLCDESGGQAAAIGPENDFYHVRRRVRATQMRRLVHGDLVRADDGFALEAVLPARRGGPDGLTSCRVIVDTLDERAERFSVEAEIHVHRCAPHLSASVGSTAMLRGCARD